MRASTCADAGAATARVVTTISFRNMGIIVPLRLMDRMRLVRPLLALALSCGVVSGCGQRPRDDQPLRFPHAPVVLISIDTLRADHLPLYGYRDGSTPTLDALAREAVVFEDAYSHCP